jgi:undecaprenyl-diphosphatase
MNFIHVAILGIVEGITEFLPISSTGHMILTADLLNLAKTAFLSSFEVGIQLGAILAVVILYAKRILTQFKLIKILIVAFIPTAVIGLVLYKVIKTYLLNNTVVVLWALLVGGIVIIIFEHFYREKPEAVAEVENISYKQAFVIGVAQSFAVIPGVSRAAATIIGGLALGLKRKTIVEFSFLLAIPTMLAATGFDLLKTGTSFTGTEWGMLAIGFIVSFFVALLAVKWLIKFIQHNSFVYFGYYRILVAIIFWLMIL